MLRIFPFMHGHQIPLRQDGACGCFHTYLCLSKWRLWVTHKRYARDASALEERPDGVAVLPVEGVPIAPQVSRTANAIDDAAHRVHDRRHSSSRGKCEGGTALACATRVGAA